MQNRRSAIDDGQVQIRNIMPNFLPEIQVFIFNIFSKGHKNRFILITAYLIAFLKQNPLNSDK